ncbi:MAG: CDP-alcohol phosphatidyltransferase family protein [Firmicutes bacterium]|jgi:archaetidylinositol phosphate synthase|nr:CDP-alcohol phosphatidyltransferase family protein [Bacillota bacterium]
MLDTHARKYVEPFFKEAAAILVKIGLSANQVTVLAFVAGTLSGPLFYAGHPVLAVIFLWLSGFLDAVDGSMARMTKTSPWGTLMDIIFDRIVEISVILGLAFRFPASQLPLLLLSCSIILSMTVFLTVGAVSEKSGMKSFYYQAGLAERTEGFIFFSLMMLFTDFLTYITLIFFGAIMFTVCQRISEAWRILK